MNDLPYRTEVVSFARRSGRLDARQQRAWDSLAATHLVEPRRAAISTSVAASYRFDASVAFGRMAPLVVEVGGGHGDAIAHAAAADPDSDFLALEVWKPGAASTLAHIGRLGLTNVRVMQVDAAEAVATMFVPGSVDELWLFFPDPWHKLRHHKRRLVSPAFAANVARALRPGGVWRLATDWEHYAAHMRRVLQDSADFEVSTGARFDGRVLTKFEKKGAGVGREIHDLTAVRH